MAKRPCLQLVLTIACLFAGVSFAQAATYYTVTDLGNLSGPIGAAANISGNGSVAGLSTLSTGNYHAVLWNGSPVDLGTLGNDTQSHAFAVNDMGTVVGV
jgi:probable HAF family extracellular repeat protein